MMNNLNSVLIEGNLVRDPELKYSPKGTAVCSFALASNRYFKQDEETQKEVSFFDVTTWSRLAEVCGEYLKKGRGVRVVGRLKQDRWTDADGKDGESGAAEGQVEVSDEQLQEEAELKEAASLQLRGRQARGSVETRRTPCGLPPLRLRPAENQTGDPVLVVVDVRPGLRYA